jgi:phage-related baseplate assembly protein
MQLSSLPDIAFAEKDSKLIESEIISAYEDLAGRTLAPGDPVRIFLLAIASVIIQQRALIDFSAKQNLLAYSSGDYLDHIGALLGVERIAAKPAVTTIRFTLSEQRQVATPIPANTRVRTGSGNIVFATTKYAEIPAGALYVDVNAQCQTPGEAGNGFLPGQVKRLIDPIPFVTSAVNITETTGGLDKESDEPFRERIRLVPETFSVAGPYRAYEYWALTAHQDIVDVAVYSPTPGQVNICPLLKGGQLPGQEVLDAVNAICSADNKRPLTDYVYVHVPTQVNYSINVTYYIRRDDASLAASIQAAVQDAVSNYKTWQKEKLGRDINPSELTRRMVNAGAKRVQVTEPTFTALEQYQVAKDTATNIVYGGLEDD